MRQFSTSYSLKFNTEHPFIDRDYNIRSIFGVNSDPPSRDEIDSTVVSPSHNMAVITNWEFKK